MISFNLGDVAHKLVLPFTLDQRTVAARDPKAISEIRCSRSVDISNSPRPEVKLSPMFALGIPKFVIAVLPASGLFVSGLYWKYPNRKSPSRVLN